MKKFVIILLLFAATASASIFLNSFNSGQLSKDLKQRHDLDKTSMGSEELTNILIRPQGMAFRRPGTEFIDRSYLTDDTPAIPAIPPAPFRDEATVISANAKVIWLASDYSVLAYEDLPGAAQICNTVTVDPDGVVVAGYSTSVAKGPCISRWDTDLVIDNTFFTPTAGWALYEWVGTVRFNHDGTYLYAAANKRIYKFDASTGAEIWQVSPNYQDGYDLYIDSDDNMYVSILTGNEWPVFPGLVKIYDSDGTLTNTLTTGGLYRDIKVDEVNDRIYVCGSTNHIDAYTGGEFPYSYHSIAAIDTDGGNWNYYSIGDSKTIWGMVKIGDYIYAAGVRTAFGFEGANASVYKFDTSLNIVDSYDTGYEATHIWVDWDDNIVVKSGSGATGGLWLLDTDLNYVADYRVTTSETYGNEGAIIPFMDDGTPEVPGVPGYYTRTDTVGGIRLIPFEYSTNDAYVLEFGHEYIGFLRTTP